MHVATRTIKFPEITEILIDDRFHERPTVTVFQDRIAAANASGTPLQIRGAGTRIGTARICKAK